MDRYEKGQVLGRGTHGTVIMAKDVQTGQTVAIKKIRLGALKEGINMTALREVKLLRELKDPHIVRLLDAFVHKDNLSLVFEYMHSDLEMVIKHRSTVLGAADVKAYMKMLLQALDACHRHWICHRDVKPNNFLISDTGEMKIGDFGLARVFGSPGRGYTNQVFARWYRAPELLFGSTLYGPAVDAWAAGCCFAELLLRKPWMPGETDVEQLGLIFQRLGTPSEAMWPGVSSLPQYVEFMPLKKPSLKASFPKAGDDAVDLLAGLTTFDPRRRMTVSQALQHRYFKNQPLPTQASLLPKPPMASHNPLQVRQQGSSAIESLPQPLQDTLEGTSGAKRKLDLTDIV